MEKIIANRLNIDQDSIQDHMHFVNDLGADSLHIVEIVMEIEHCLLYTSPSPRDGLLSRMPSSA